MSRPSQVNDPPGRPQAAIYVRASTERQSYSTDHQRAMICSYATLMGMDIVREYADEGKSGLDIRRRAGLQALMNDVQSGEAPYSKVIVYDVTRWGRFQDVDEAGFYEHLCRRSGIGVLYCQEQFANDGSPMASLIKSMKRAMAAEYSRELSAKVFSAHCRFVEMGFKQGGHAGFGLRRLAVTEHGQPRGILRYGEQKPVSTDRVILVPGPKDEIAIVHWIYAQYLERGMSEAAIARALNAEGVQGEFGRAWTQDMVNSILTNAKYVGSIVYNRKSSKLSTLRRRNNETEWLINRNAFEPVVEEERFLRAQDERLKRNKRYESDELLSLLRQCHSRHGKVTADVLAADPEMPDHQIFVRTFGSLLTGYEKAGLPHNNLLDFIVTKRVAWSLYLKLFHQACAAAASKLVEADERTGRLTLDGNVKVKVEVATMMRPVRGFPKWKLNRRDGMDFCILGRFDTDQKILFDHWLFRPETVPRHGLYLRREQLPPFWHVRARSVDELFTQCVSNNALSDSE